MSTIVMTTEEFSTRRKLRYGTGENKPPTYSLNSSSLTANLSPHKCYYDKDEQGNNIYTIEFKIGEFNFDEISIRTEGHRLIVQGKSKLGREPDEISREFRRDFTLPNDVDQSTIRAQLDEATRQLSLIGNVRKVERKEYATTTNSYAESKADDFDYMLGSMSLKAAKVGSIKENRTSSHVEYEIFLGAELKDGQINIDISGHNQLNIRAIKSDWDKNGDFSVELKRQIKLPPGANPDDIEHGINERAATLTIKVPCKN